MTYNQISFWGWCNFQISFSGRDVRESLKSSLRKYYSPYMRILANTMKFPSPEFYTTFWSMTKMQRHPPSIKLTYDVVIKLNLITEFDLFTKFREVSIKHLQPSGRLVLSDFRLASVLMFISVSPKLIKFPNFELRTSLCTSILLSSGFEEGPYWFQVKSQGRSWNIVTYVP